MLKKVFCAILVFVVSASMFIGCNTSEESSQSQSQSSSATASSDASTASESSESEDKVLAPTIDPSEVTSQPAEVSSASVFTVDTALREKYFDILARNYSSTLPIIDFASADQMSTNEMVDYAVGVTEYLQHSQTTAASMYLFDFLELQKSLQKYLGVQINYTSNITGFIYNSGNNILYAEFVLPIYTYYYRLENLSLDADGKYTAVFSVYRDIFTTEDSYNNSLADIRTAVTGDTVTTDLTKTSEVTITFKEMVDSDSSIYLFLLSKSTVKQ